MNLSVPNFKRTRLACFTACFTMASVFCLPPLLFVTLREMYDISYTLLGTLVLTNFCTQLAVDLLFTAFSKHFNIKKIVRIMPLVTTLGLLIYALIPTLFPHVAYAGLWIGTVIFSMAAGLSEVLLSPIIAAIPSDDPQKDMSTLHSLYAFGVFFVVVVSTAFFALFGTQRWMYLTAFFALLPVVAAVLFCLSPMPDMQRSAPTRRAGGGRRAMGLGICTVCIFFGSCAENGMANWISGYIENALGIDKTVGDLLGMAVFAVLLGAVRFFYGRFGKRIRPVLLVGMFCSAVCYLVVGLCHSATLAVVACVLTGLFSSMLWPGTLILMEESVPDVGVAAYALMAAGGDLGASVAPQLLGVVADRADLKAGMLAISAFPLCGIVALLFAFWYFGKRASKIKER